VTRVRHRPEGASGAPGDTSRELRLLHVIASVDPATGGPIEGIVRQNEACGGADGLVHRHIVSLDVPDAAFLRDFPIPVTPLGDPAMRGPLAHYHYSPAFVPWLRANLRRFDVALVHGLWNYAAFGASRVLPGAGVPYFAFVHGMLDPWFRETYPLKHLAKQAFWLAGEGRLLAGAKAVFFTSAEEMRAADGMFFGPRYRGEVVGYGVAGPPAASQEQAAAFRAAVPTLGDRRFLLFLGRLHPKKGCDLLVDAFAAASKPSDLDLVIAGPDAVGWRAELTALASVRGIDGRVHWPGPLYGAAKWGAIRAADAFVLPSHQENFGIAVAEALACGTPVLISDKVNIWREVVGGGAGLVDRDTLDGTRQLLDAWIGAMPAQRQQMAAAARRLFETNFDVARTAPALIERMRALSEGARRTPPAGATTSP
jgi:glycosyltransferase involved in cell wall biosynthesis